MTKPMKEFYSFNEVMQMVKKIRPSAGTGSVQSILVQASIQNVWRKNENGLHRCAYPVNKIKAMIKKLKERG